jgi:hypothetical protein
VSQRKSMPQRLNGKQRAVRDQGGSPGSSCRIWPAAQGCGW